MEDLQLAPPGLLRRSTLHRALQARGLSARKLVIPDNQDLDRWQADCANDLWQADMLQGPWLPDPHRKGKMRRSYLYAFLDDASRLLLYGRFFFKGDLPALELVFKRSLQRYGKPKRVYYDNGMVFKSNHMKLVCAEPGTHHPIHTRPYRPMGHGKIEAFNRFCVNHFIAEVKASHIITLHQLNEAFFAWVGEEYNRRKHAEIGMTPKQRWEKDASRIQYIEEEKLRIAFLWREMRTPDKTGVIRLFNRRYKVSPFLAKKRIEVRYDPERLDQIEIYLDGVFKQRAKPLQMTPNRAPKELLPLEQDQSPEEKTDYPGWLTHQHKTKIKITPPVNNSPKAQTLTGFLNILREHISREVFDEKEATAFFQAFGPFDPDRLKRTMDDLLAAGPHNLHISFYLNHIQTKLLQRIIMNQQRLHLKSYSGFSRVPFTKYMWASKMFDAKAQQELINGLHLWLETRGIALLYGPPGVGKSISLRKFKADLDERRFEVFYLFNLRITPTGFLRGLSRILTLPVLYHQADLFDAISAFLNQYEERTGKHPIIIFDDGDGLSDKLLELLRLLSNFNMDSEDRFSFILSGSQRLALRIRGPQNEPLRQRIVFSHNLRGFTITTINRILSRNCLTHRRTGYYPEDYIGN